MNHGDIFWAELGNRGGRAQAGRRPSIIWHDLTRFPTNPVLAIPLTSSLGSAKLPATVLLQPTAINGLPRPSVAMIFQMVAIDAQYFGGYIGRLDDPDLLKIADLARQLQRL